MNNEIEKYLSRDKQKSIRKTQNLGSMPYNKYVDCRWIDMYTGSNIYFPL